MNQICRERIAKLMYMVLTVQWFQHNGGSLKESLAVYKVNAGISEKRTTHVTYSYNTL